ncbi:putative Zinc finger, RING-type, patatin-like phospholipase domain-containing protein [Septoria linicola]|nr:putative Zinc finger, RING-type, patatin-like phospholipase domain-containing protein [Septoria linicola]
MTRNVRDSTYTADDVSSESSCSDDEPSEECEDDRCRGPTPPIWHCVDCDSSYCSDCWALQGPHKPKKKGRDGVPHEKTSPFVVKRLKGILNPTRNPDMIQKLHEDDESTKWFGVARDPTGRPNFEDYGRYATLMSSISPISVQNAGNRYPQIVSFIGVTNAGKSTLIKMLINHDAHNNVNAENRALFPSPVVGSVVNDSLPTSGDVHLYADPTSHTEQLPILYADCEGFEGGERTPLGARSRKRANSEPEVARPGHVHTRPIEWANNEESRQREYAVTALYPRLLYTFSDCVVFVLRNPKTFQSAVLTKLLDWGASSLEKSLNQPALPHCIVAINGTDPSVDDKEWDVNYATQSLLSSVKGALDYIEGVPRFRELAEYWRNLGKHIYTVEDLILRYYSSFKVIRIPAKPRYTTINEQVGKLQGIIKANCEESFRNKRRARMLTNADELNTYLQSGFDHFTSHLDIPFNFMRISLLRNPIPNDFGGHILQLCTTIGAQQPNHQHGRIAWVFEKMSVMLASCVLLDCARFRKGRVDELFSNYEKFFDWAMGEYLEMHYPCSYISADGTRQCMLVKARHNVKGHQDEKGIIATGDYQAAFDVEFLPRWKSQLRAAIGSIARDFQYELEQITQGDEPSIPEERIALDLHIEYVNQFFEAVGPASSMVSHATCFCCLMDVPEHPLPCGHVLCTACIKAYGKSHKSAVQVTCCPLHRESTNWAKPANIRFKPVGAGVRILSLDGGGIRGVVQLEVLRAIEQALGGHLPVQSFFDLIIGTGTGGLIATALSLKERSIDSITDMFSAMCDHAFTPRLKGVPVISQIAQMFGSAPKYKTKPLLGALKTAFTEGDDLFGSHEKPRNGARVALTSTSATGLETILIASYRRPEDPMPAYAFERPHDPEMELKTHEAIAASLASPAFFKPFVFHSKTYLDGGLRSPNPAFIADRERRLIWPDAGEPDIFLSLGTGQNRITVLQKLSDRQKAAALASVAPTASQSPTKSKPSGRWRNKRTDDVLEAELAWQHFRHHVVREKSGNRGRRFVRFNPDLDREPPTADSKSDLLSLQVNVRKRLQTAHRQSALRNVAHRLVASSFYLELQSKATAEKSEQVCTGVITCRFDDGSPELAALGRILEERRTDDFEPYFLVKPDMEHSDFSFKIPISQAISQCMIKSAVFGLPNVYIPLRNENNPTSITIFLSKHDGLEPDGFAISGFPRVLLGEPKNPKTKRPVRSSSDQHLRRPSSRNPRLDGDSLSLNGANMASNRSVHSEESWQDIQARDSRTASGEKKQSLADLISQHQNVGNGSIKRTNRFWTYIGNHHMAQNPEMYSHDELAKHGIDVSAFPRPPSAAAVELPTTSTGFPPNPSPEPIVEYPSPEGTTALPSLRSRYAFPQMSGIPELDSNEKSKNEHHEHRGPDGHPLLALTQSTRSQVDLIPQIPTREASAASNHSTSQSSTNTTTQRSSNASRQPEIPSMCETEFEDDDDWVSTYSGEEVMLAEAHASPLVQFPPVFPTRRSSKGDLPVLASTHTTAAAAAAEQNPLETAIAGAMPDENTATALDRWLAAQKSASSLVRKNERLKVVHEEIEGVDE